LVKGATGAATTSTYAYTDTAHPAALTSVADGVTTDSFGYDGAGRMVSRTVDGVPTALTWDVTSSLTDSDGQGGHVVYAYDASGQRVVQARVADANGVGSATAYVASGQVDDANTASTSTGDVSATRYYTFGGSTVAVRADDGQLSLMLGDEQGSTNVMMPVTVEAGGALASATIADAAAVTRTSYTPYGELRGADNLATDRGWLGQVEDRVDGASGTGLTYLNARYYDPVTSRFISPDPLMNPGDPRTLDPYRYADNNPVVFTDASGLKPLGQYDYAKGGTYRPTNSGTVQASPAKPSVGRIFGSIKSGIGSAAGAAKSGIGSAAGAAKSGIGSAAGAAKSGIVTAGGAVKAGIGTAFGAARSVSSAAWDRGTTWFQYSGQFAWRRARDPLQAWRDDVSLTSAAEGLVGSFQILVGDAELVNKGKYCGNAGECLKGGFTPIDSDGNGQAITIGHTVTFPRGEEVTAHWIEHEFAHVLQYEIAGALLFGADYGLEQAYGVTFGHKSKEQAYWDQSTERWARAGLDPGWWTPRRRGCSSWEDCVGSLLLSSRTRP